MSTDTASGFITTDSLKTKTAIEVAEKLIKLWLVTGFPAIANCDFGKEFNNSYLIEKLSSYGTVIMPIRPEQKNAVYAETQNARYLQILRRSVSKSIEWPFCLEKTSYCLNHSLVKYSKSKKATPASLFYQKITGMVPCDEDECFSISREMEQLNRERFLDYDSLRMAIDKRIVFEIKELVLIKRNYLTGLKSKLKSRMAKIEQNWSVGQVEHVFPDTLTVKLKSGEK